jgi:hypothetical protein
MRVKVVALAVLVILATLLAVGVVSQEARAQSYAATVDFAFQTSSFLGQDITVFGRVTVLVDRTEPDEILITLTAPDTGTVQESINIPFSAQTGDEFPFNITHFTFVKGQFTLVVKSTVENEVIFTRNFPVPNYQVSVSISATEGEIGTEFVVETTIDSDEMTVIFTRFDIQYIVDGSTVRQSEVVVLVDPSLLPPQYKDYGNWYITQSFAFEAGDHTLEVRIIDESIGEEVFSKSFTIRVVDQFQGIEDRLAAVEAAIVSLESNVTLFGVDVSAVKAEIETLRQEIEAARQTYPTVGERLDDLEERLNQLESRAVALERTSAVTTPVAWLSLVAIVLSSISLLVQFGILKLRRKGEG